MDSLTLPCPRCAPTSPVTVADDTIRCLGCGLERPFVRASLYLVTGAPATGKSSAVAHLNNRLADTVVLDTDLFGPWSNPDWSAWASSWLLLAYGLAQSRTRALLVGYGITKTKAELLAPRLLFGPVRAINLDLTDDQLRERLRLRPGYDDDRIERKVVAAAQLRDEADENIDVTGLSAEDVAHLIRASYDALALGPYR